MKYKLSIFIFIIMAAVTLSHSVCAASNIYNQSLSVGDDGTTYTPQPEETKYVTPISTEDSKDKEDDEEKTNDNGYYYPYPYYPYPYYNQPFYGTPGIVFPGYRPTPPPPNPNPRPPRPPKPNKPDKPQNGGMVIHRNPSGHGYNYGSEGNWISRPVAQPNRVLPSRPSVQPPPPPNSMQQHPQGRGRH